MKTIFFIAVCIAVSVFSAAQERNLNSESQNVTLPQFNGKNFYVLTQGTACRSLDDYLHGCVCYPETCLRQQLEGTEVVEFVVTPEGTLTSFNVINSLSPEIDKHVINLLKNTNGMWIPGKINDQAVPMKNEISVVFKYSPNQEYKPADFDHIAQKYFNKGSKQLFLLHKPEKALKNFNAGIRYMPNEVSLLMFRGICLYETGDEMGARRDWERMKKLAKNLQDFQYYVDDLDELKGYDELSDIIRRE